MMDPVLDVTLTELTVVDGEGITAACLLGLIGGRGS